MSNVVWGPTDALEHDDEFTQKWIEPSAVKKCLLRRNWLISGEKGSGKSALRRAITEVYGSNYIAAPVVDFNGITFKALHANLVEIARTTKLSKTATLSHFWQYSMLIELLHAAAVARPHDYQQPNDSHPHASSSLSLADRLLNLLESMWNRIDTFTDKRSHRLSDARMPANLVASGGLSADILTELSSFPLESRFADLKKQFFRRLQETGDRIVLVLDGFDRLNNDDSQGAVVHLIFASLVDAVQSIHSDPDLPNGLEIKAFIPHDRYLSITLRDSDKIDTMHVAIRWERGDLQEFLKRRLALTPRLQGNSFPLLWRQVMPEQVTNSHYRLDEDSFDYILRHTMMRPRQLQIHLEHIASEKPDQIIAPSGIPKAISESSKKVAKHFINEFRTEHPNIERFIGSLNKTDNVLEYKEFRRIVEDAIVRFHIKDEHLSVESKVDTLYAMGLFGIVNWIEPNTIAPDVYCPPTRESQRHYVDFFYKNPHPSISSTLKDESVIAFHPVFVDYANLRPHSSLVIG